MKRILLLATVFSVLNFQFSIFNSLSAQGTVFSYTHQGATLYYTIDGTGNAMVVPPMHPVFDTANYESWNGYSKPQGTVVIPDSVPYAGANHAVTEIGPRALMACSEVQSIVVPEGVTTTGEDAFSDCTSLQSVTLPTTLTSLGNFSFFGCTSLSDITIPEGLTWMGAKAFKNCQSLQSVSLPGTLVTIPEEAFIYCSSLETVTLHEGTVNIDPNAFYGCHSLTSINLPSTLTYIGSHGFYETTSLVAIDIPGSVESISDWAFYGSGLQTLTLHEGLLAIEMCAFNKCHSLTTVNFPSTLNIIDRFAFNENYSMEEVILPEGLSTLGRAAFQCCSSLRRVSLPQSLVELYGWTFWGCQMLDSITFPDNLRSIGKSVLCASSGLKYCHLPERLEILDSWALYGTALEELVIPSQVSVLDSQSLAGCEHLRKLTLPASLTLMGDSLFIDGTELDTLILLCANPPTVTESVFPSYNATVVVPCGASEDYSQHPIWGRFTDITENCNGIDELSAENREWRVYLLDGRIAVEGAAGERVQVFDITGREIVSRSINSQLSILNYQFPSGVYIVKVGSREAQRVVVFK